MKMLFGRDEKLLYYAVRYLRDGGRENIHKGKTFCFLESASEVYFNAVIYPLVA